MQDQSNLTHWTERTDMAAAFRWTARLNMHEAVANHFSLAVNHDGSRFLINPAGRHFARIIASTLIFTQLPLGVERTSLAVLQVGK